VKCEEYSPGGHLVRRAVYPLMTQSGHAQGDPILAGALVMLISSVQMTAGLEALNGLQ
jgi:hypothetical protein